MATTLVERVTARAKKSIRVPEIGGLALIARKGAMSAVAEVGKAKLTKQNARDPHPGAALLGVGDEVVVKNPRGWLITFRRNR